MKLITKRVALIATLVAALCLSMFAIASCGTPEIVGLTFADSEVEYDGAEHTLEVSGLPQGATVTYSPEGPYKDAGEYQITATVKQEGFADKTLTAKLTISPKAVTVSYSGLKFKANGEAPEITYTVNDLIEGDTVELEFDFGDCDFTETGDGYTFKAKSKNPNYTLKKVSAEKEFELVENVHTVYYDTGVEGVTLDPEEEVNDNGRIRAPRSITNSGYEFLGWFNGEEQWDFDNDRVKGDMTLVAKWQPKTYTISYQLNGGVNFPDNPTSYVYDEGATVYAPTKEGYMFLGWYSDRELTTPAKELVAKTFTKNVTFYAKWTEVKYTNIIADKTLSGNNLSITGDKSCINGDFRYTFVANITDFGEDGKIFIGRGKTEMAGSYAEITADSIIVHTVIEGGESLSDKRTHSRDMRGYVVVDVNVISGKAKITIHTVEGSNSTDIEWSGRNGEIFVSCENASFDNASFGWYTTAYEQPVWIIGDETVGLDKTFYWTNRLSHYKYGDFLSIGADGIDSTDVLEMFRTTLKTRTPIYAVWSFTKESGAEYDANVEEFIRLCKDKKVTPILTTQPVEFASANAAKNEYVKESGERYIDFAVLSSSSNAISNGAFTIVGAEEAFARVMVDFPEIICAEVPVSSESATTLSPVTNLKLDSTTKAPEGSLYIPSTNVKNILTGEDVTGVAGNAIKDGKYLVFTAKLNGTLAAGQTISVGHGYHISTGNWIDITSDKAVVYSYTSWGNPPETAKDYTHRLTIKNYITVIVTLDIDDMGQTLSIFTDGGAYYQQISWSGTAGAPYAMSQGVTLTDAKIDWVCKDYAKDIWMFGDSYFSIGDAARWPTYMYNNGYPSKTSYQNALVVGCSGMQTKAAYENLYHAIYNVGAKAPKYVVWCMGMNDADTNGAISTSYKTYTELAIEICERNNIDIVIATIPNCPVQDNSYKNADILNGNGIFEGVEYRVIDFAHAVVSDVFDPSIIDKEDYGEKGKNKTGYDWYDGMLHSDIVHPALPGAKGLYMQFIHDFPEIAGGIGSETYEKALASVSAGTEMVLPKPATIGDEQIITFTADINGKYGNSTLKIGNGGTAEGSTWVEITGKTAAAYMMIGGEAVRLSEEVITHNVIVDLRLAVKIHVAGGKAKISFYSVGEEKVTPNNNGGFTYSSELFSFEAEWATVGNLFAVSEGMALQNAELRWRTW